MSSQLYKKIKKGRPKKTSTPPSQEYYLPEVIALYQFQVPFNANPLFVNSEQRCFRQYPELGRKLAMFINFSQLSKSKQLFELLRPVYIKAGVGELEDKDLEAVRQALKESGISQEKAQEYVHHSISLVHSIK